ncbi:aldehyde dehydrogenase family protein, partial [Halomonas sp. BBD48]|nr:aldehyde dehydrogenase family protein [Halomonas sp. BBD48]
MTASMTHADWQRLAGELTYETRAFIGQRFVEAASGQRFPVINPATGEQLAEVASCDNADVELAVRHAREAFERGGWSRLAPGKRRQAMLRLAELMETHKHELALLDTL